jgi:hypothetical protein
MNLPIESIMKYIMSVYKPDDVQISKDYWGTGIQIKLDLFFKHIDDSYLRNPMATDKIRNKEDQLEMRIRKDLELFFAIQTTGWSIERRGNDFEMSAPYIMGDITIDVFSDERKNRWDT